MDQLKNKIAIVTPVYNDWDCFSALLSEIESLHKANFKHINIIVVNDCSFEEPKEKFNSSDRVNITRLDLVTNVGHQRAILIGLCHLYETNDSSDYVIIMDSDGEDKPEDISKLIAKCKSSIAKKIIFANRTTRSEGLLFRTLYMFYKMLFTSLTGLRISFGNFSCVPVAYLPKICNSPNFWNHYSSAVIKSKIPYDSVNTSRGTRYFGKSKMKLTNLILHGLSSISLYMETIIVRLLKVSLLSFLLLLAGLGVIVYIRYFTDRAIPGWSSFLFAIIFNILVTVSLFSLMIILLQLNNRNQPIYRPFTFYKELIAKK